MHLPKHSKEPCPPVYGIVLALMKCVQCAKFPSLSHLTLRGSTVIICILRGCNRGLERFMKLPRIEYLPRSGVRTQVTVVSPQGYPNKEEMNYLPGMEVQHPSFGIFCGMGCGRST